MVETLKGFVRYEACSSMATVYNKIGIKTYNNVLGDKPDYLLKVGMDIFHPETSHLC